jgi:hypothetical protein
VILSMIRFKVTGTDGRQHLVDAVRYEVRPGGDLVFYQGNDTTRIFGGDLISEAYPPKYWISLQSGGLVFRGRTILTNRRVKRC